MKKIFTTPSNTPEYGHGGNGTEWLMMIPIYLLLLWLLCSCGANYHLKRSEHHLKKAIAKGAIISSDTIWKAVEIYVPEVTTDTLFRSVQGDTVRIEKDRLKIKYVKLPGDSVYIEGKCETDTVKVEVPVTVTKTIQATTWLKWWHLIVAAGLGALAMIIRRI